jgi:hypothetical protein
MLLKPNAIKSLPASLQKPVATLTSTETLKDAVPAVMSKVTELSYDKFARQQDKADLPALEAEIEARIKSTGNGVLIKRITMMITDSAGDFAPRYLGLIVAADGPSSAEAEINYNKGLKQTPAKNNSLGDAVCTISNPTGERKTEGAMLKAAPEGFNNGYASQLAGKMMRVLEKNPSNVGSIEFGSTAFFIQPNSYLKEDFFFISKEDWLNRDGICRAG